MLNTACLSLMPTKGPTEPEEALVKESRHTHIEQECDGEERDD